MLLLAVQCRFLTSRGFLLRQDENYDKGSGKGFISSGGGLLDRMGSATDSRPKKARGKRHRRHHVREQFQKLLLLVVWFCVCVLLSFSCGRMKTTARATTTTTTGRRAAARTASIQKG